MSAILPRAENVNESRLSGGEQSLYPSELAKQRHIARARFSGLIPGLIAAPARAPEAREARSERNGRRETFAARTRRWSENATLRGRFRSPCGPASRRTRRLDSSAAVQSSKIGFVQRKVGAQNRKHNLH